MTAADMPMSSSDATTTSSAITSLRTDSVAKKLEIPANSNANDYIENGIYTIGATNSTSISNLAMTGASELVVFTSTAYTLQTQYILGDGTTPPQAYQRYLRNNTWSSWSEIARKDQIDVVKSSINDFIMTRLTTSGSANNTLKIKLPESATEYIFFVFGSGSGGTTINYTLYARRSTNSAVICNLGTASNVASISDEYVLIKGVVWQAVCMIADHDVTTEWVNT
jgi:hypothetical protein